jgi:hypothetical protein
VATLLRDHLARCHEARVVAGLATSDGVAALQLEGEARKIARLVLAASGDDARASLTQMTPCATSNLFMSGIFFPLRSTCY